MLADFKNTKIFRETPGSAAGFISTADFYAEMLFYLFCCTVCIDRINPSVKTLLKTRSVTPVDIAISAMLNME